MDSTEQEKAAVAELTKGLDLVTELWCLIDQQSGPSAELCDAVISSIERGLSLIKTTPYTSQYLSIPTQLKRKSTSVNDPYIRKKQTSKKVFITDSPLDGCYEWKKYGQKSISNRKYQRSYYQCKSDKCSGKVRVQQISSGEFPEYEVIVANEHSCDMITQHGNNDQIMETSSLEVKVHDEILSSNTESDEHQQLPTFDFSLDDQALVDLMSFIH